MQVSELIDQHFAQILGDTPKNLKPVMIGLRRDGTVVTIELDTENDEKAVQPEHMIAIFMAKVAEVHGLTQIGALLLGATKRNNKIVPMVMSIECGKDEPLSIRVAYMAQNEDDDFFLPLNIAWDTDPGFANAIAPTARLQLQNALGANPYQPGKWQTTAELIAVLDGAANNDE